MSWQRVHVTGHHATLPGVHRARNDEAPRCGPCASFPNPLAFRHPALFSMRCPGACSPALQPQAPSLRLPNPCHKPLAPCCLRPPSCATLPPWLSLPTQIYAPEPAPPPSGSLLFFEPFFRPRLGFSAPSSPSVGSLMLSRYFCGGAGEQQPGGMGLGRRLAGRVCPQVETQAKA